MTVLLSDKDAAILLGATLMHWGVPFHFALKHELTPEQLAVVDLASEKLIAAREALQQRPEGTLQSVLLSKEEITLVIHVAEDCLHECGNDTVELDLQLHTRDRTEVERLVQRLRTHATAKAGVS